MLPAELVQCGVFAIGIVFFTDAVQLESVLLVKGTSLGIAVADFQKALVAIFGEFIQTRFQEQTADAFALF